MKIPSLYTWTSILAGALVALASLSPLVAQDLSYSGSLGFSSGSYIFADRTESLALLNGLRVSRGRISFSATLPIISQTSGDVAFLGGGMMPTGGSGHQGATGEHSGTGMGMGSPGSTGSSEVQEVMHSSFETTIADPLFAGSIRVFQGLGTLRSLTVEAKAKAPLAPLSSGVGTGAWDFGMGASSVMSFGRTLVLLGASYWSPGDLPDLVLKSYTDASIGVGRLLGRRWSVLSSVNLATAVIENLDPPASAGVSLGFRPSSGRSLSGGFSIGLTEASPDFSVFLGWSFGLHRSVAG